MIVCDVCVLVYMFGVCDTCACVRASMCVCVCVRVCVDVCGV
jgi:hypothetical protein